MYFLEYANSKGKVIRITLNSDHDLAKWIEKLDKRIEKGTCGGYLVTVI